MKNKKGFTLIELLVVVAIIGLLAGVVLTSIGPARTKARDARIISALTQVRAIAETLYNGNYSALPGTAGTAYGVPITGSVLDFTKTAIDIDGNGGKLYIDKTSGDTGYAAYSALPSDPVNKYWCVDSTGASGQRSGLSSTRPNGQGVCP